MAIARVGKTGLCADRVGWVFIVCYPGGGGLGMWRRGRQGKVLMWQVGKVVGWCDSMYVCAARAVSVTHMAHVRRQWWWWLGQGGGDRGCGVGVDRGRRC